MKNYWKATAFYADGTTREKTFTYASDGKWSHDVAERGLCERRMFLEPNAGNIKRVKVELIRG